MESMEMFKNGRIIVQIDRSDDVMCFLEECKKMNIRWISGQEATAQMMVEILTEGNRNLAFFVGSDQRGHGMMYSVYNFIGLPLIPRTKYNAMKPTPVYTIEKPSQ